jgi:predicted nucleic acid-binding protein
MEAVLDSSIFLEAWLEQEYLEVCKQLIRRYTYGENTCIVPIIVPGEVLRGILEEKADPEHVRAVLSEYVKVFFKHNIEFIRINPKILKTKEALDEEEGLRMGEQDKLIVACAMWRGCSTLFTKDGNLIDDKEVVSSFSRGSGQRLNVIDIRTLKS